MPVTILVPRQPARQARDLLCRFLEGAGDFSVKAFLEADDAEYTAFDSCRVQEANVQIITLASVEYLAAQFEVHITGKVT